MKLITPMTDLQTGKSTFAVWEYDENKPRNLEAVDPRQHYAVKSFVGNFKTQSDARQCDSDGTATAAANEDLPVPKDCQAQAVRHRTDAPC